MYKDIINKFETERDILLSDIENYKTQMEKCNEEKTSAEDARLILQLAAKKTQEKIEIHFSDLVTKTFQAVLRNPYNFHSKFIERRNKTECDLLLERNGIYYKPKYATGGGVFDLTSFALRLAYHKIEKTSPILIFDEPFGAISKTLIPKVAELLQLLSNKFNLQMIFITHTQELADIANVAYEIVNGEAHRI